MTRTSSTSNSTATTTLANDSNASFKDALEGQATAGGGGGGGGGPANEQETQERLKLLLLRAKQSARAKSSALNPAGKDSLAHQEEIVRFDNDDNDDGQELGSTKKSNRLPIALVRPVHLSAPTSSVLAQPTPLDKGKGRAISSDVSTTTPGDKWGRAPLKSLSKKEQRDRHPPTAGPKWFNLPAPVVTPELKREIQAMRLRNALDPKRFYKGGAKDKDLPEFFAVGHLLPSTTSASTAAPSIARKRTFVEELISDEQAKAYAKKKFVNEVMVKGMSGKARSRGKKVSKDAGWKKDGRRG